jgi:hypothetical protein
MNIVPKDHIAVPIKWGNKQTAPGKDHLGIKHMMPVCIIDPLDSGWTKEPKLGRMDKISFGIVLLPRKHKKTIQDMLEPTEKDPYSTVTIDYRVHSGVFDPVILSSLIDDPRILTKWGTEGQSVNPVIIDELPEGLIRDSREVFFDVQDKNAITSGTYLIGGDNPDYATCASFFADFGNLTGNLEGQVDGDVTETTTSLMTESLGGYEFKLTSNYPSYGDPTKGYKISHNFNEQLFNFQQEGSGTTIVEHLYIKTIYSLTNDYNHMIFSAISTNFSLKIHDCMCDRNGEMGRSIVVYDSTLTGIEIWGNTLWGGKDHASSIGIHIGQVGSGSKVENNSIKGYKYNFDFGSQSLTAKNNVGVDGITNDFRNIGSATGNNNASTDTTVANGNWSSGSGNQTSITKADEFMTLDDTSKYFFKVYQGGVCYNNGTTPSITGNTIGSRGNTRPYDGSNYSIGSDEYRIDMFFSAGDSATDRKVASNVTITDNKATFSVAQTGNIGVGDIIDYDVDNKKMFIVGKLDTSNWLVRTATGGIPGDIAGKTVNSIKRSFASLTAAMDTAAAGAGDASHLNTYDIDTANIQLSIACYKDQIDVGGDTEITGWTVNSSHFIKIYAPHDTTHEVNTRQRHTGIAGTGYRINPSGPINIAVIYIQEQYTVVEGIEIYDFGTVTDAGIQASTAADYSTIDSNIIHDDGGTTVRGINVSLNADYVTIINNIVYDMSEHGIVADDNNYIYNNTVYNCAEDGINNNNSTPVVVNNISMGNGQKDYEDNGGSWGTGSDYNLDSDGLAPGANSIHNKSAGNQFVSIVGGSEDFHLKASSDAIDNGIGPSSDSNVPVLDIDLELRSGTITDIGVEESGLVHVSFIPTHNIGRGLGIGLSEGVG